MSRTLLASIGLLVLSPFVRSAGDTRRDLEIDPPPVLLPAREFSEASRLHFDALKLYHRARAKQQDHEILEALKLYEQALQREPAAVSIYKSMIPLCMHLDQRGRVIELCREALKHAPEDFELLVCCGQELQLRGKTKEAIEVLSKAANLSGQREQLAQHAQLCMTLGGLLEEEKEYTKAAVWYHKVLEAMEGPGIILAGDDAAKRHALAEETAKVQERLGRVELQAGRFDAAVAAFEKAQEKDPVRAGRLHLNLCEVYEARRDLQRALAHLERYVATQPGGSEAYEKLVQLLTALERAGDILPALEQASQRDPFNQSLRLVLAGQYAAAGQPTKAEVLYQACLRENPSEDAYRGLARLCLQQGRGEELVKRLDQDLRDPRRVATVRPQMQVLLADRQLTRGMALAGRAMPQGGQDLDVRTRRVLATLCRQARQYDLAEHFCRLCLVDEHQPDEVYLELCRILSEAGKHEAEAAVCREALARNLRVPAAVFQLELARALSMAGHKKEAIAQAREVVAQAAAGSDEAASAGLTLLSVYYRSGELDLALAEGEKLLASEKSARNRRQIEGLMAGICMTRHEHDRAEQFLQKILAADPEDMGACNDLGYLWADQGKNLDEAERLIRKAIELDRTERQRRYKGLELPDEEKDNAAYIDSLGWVLFRKGRLEEACRQLELATDLVGGDDPTIWDHLGDVYVAMGHAGDARIAWTKAMELYRANKRPGPEDRRQEVERKLKGLIQQTRKP